MGVFNALGSSKPGYGKEEERIREKWLTRLDCQVGDDALKFIPRFSKSKVHKYYPITISWDIRMTSGKRL